MATATTPTAQSTPTTPATPASETPEHPLLAQRSRSIQGWHQAQAELQKAQEAERSAPKPSPARALARKARLSWGAKKANRKAEIAQTELDLRLEGIEFDKWVEPETPAANISRLIPMTQAELESKLAAVRALHATLTDNEADVKKTAEQRITALLKSAEQRGYKVS